MNKIVAFECEYCNSKIYRHESSAKSHERKCYANPINKACRTCIHAIKGSETVYVPPHVDQNYGDADYEQPYIWCEVKEKYLHHPVKLCEFEHHCIHWELGEKLF